SAADAKTPLGRPLTSSLGVLSSARGMTRGWPVGKGGTGALVNALAKVITEYGGEIHTGQEVTNIDDLPPARATMLDITPAQALVVRGKQLRELPGAKVQRVQRRCHGPGGQKVEWGL